MKHLICGFALTMLMASSMAMAADATSMQAIDVTPQASSGGGGIMTASELFNAAKGRSAGKFTVQANGLLFNSDHGDQCKISSGSCTSTQNGMGIPATYAITSSGLLAYEAVPNGDGYIMATTLYQWR